MTSPVMTLLTQNCVYFEPILCWWHHHVDSKLQILRERFHKQIISPQKYPLLLVLIFLSILVHEIPIWTFSFHFLVVDVTTRSQNFKTLRWWIRKLIFLLKISFDYWLSSFYRHWYMKYKFRPFLTQFCVNGVNTGVKTAIFWETDSRNKLLISTFHQILIPVFLSPLIHDIQLWALFTQFGDNDIANK